MNETAQQIEQLASRAVSLYSRPTVALELVRLADSPAADAQALKDCVAQDPALACKLLRVVNSSLYGLHRPVGDLNQAIGQIGIKPLKLLVLGFNLPDSLFAEVAARELEWYWTNTLTRAVAARLLGEQLWHNLGDEAFIAGLLQDIGVLVLLRELGEPYARFLTGVIDEKCHLAVLEQDTLGFDHIQLTAALLSKWQLPQGLVDAIEMPKRTSRLERMSPPDGDLPQILHLAELLAQLVGQQRLTVLPDLLEAGKLYRGMTKSKLISLVEGLQPQVDQLAQVLSLELSADRDYLQMLADAQQQMARIGEQIASDSVATEDDEIYSQLLAHTDELTEAMQWFLAGKKLTSDEDGTSTRSHAAHRGKFSRTGKDKSNEADERGILLRTLTGAASRCRDRRQELSLIVAQSASADANPELLHDMHEERTDRALAAACNAARREKSTIVKLAAGRVAAIIQDCDRRSALAVAHDAIATFSKHLGSRSGDEGDYATTLAIGVATLSFVPKNFDAPRVVESAMRCLAAARAGGISAVKSIEV